MNDLDNSISGSAEDIDDCGPDTADSVLMAKGGRLATRVKPATVRVKQIAKMARTQERRKIKTNTRKEHRKKFKDRIQHLRKKYRENMEEKIRVIPTDMEELSELRVFNPEKYREIQEEEYEIKIIGDIDLNEKGIKTPPKICNTSKTNGG